METWLEEVEPLTLKGQIAVPYTWWVGETGSRFLASLRDEGKILGNRCDQCNTVYVPPRKRLHHRSIRPHASTGKGAFRLRPDPVGWCGRGPGPHHPSRDGATEKRRPCGCTFQGKR